MHVVAFGAVRQFGGRLRSFLGQTGHSTASEPGLMAKTPSGSCPWPPCFSILRCTHHHMILYLTVPHGFSWSLWRLLMKSSWSFHGLHENSTQNPQILWRVHGFWV